MRNIFCQLSFQTLTNTDMDTSEFSENTSSSDESMSIKSSLEASGIEEDDRKSNLLKKEREDPKEKGYRIWNETAKWFNGKRIFPAADAAEGHWRLKRPWSPCLGPPENFETYVLCRQESQWRNIMRHPNNTNAYGPGEFNFK